MAQVQRIDPIILPEKETVAAYCRVSTDSKDQMNSYQTQIAYYTQLIAENPEWELVDIYADAGITGTSIEKRDEFKRLLADCRAGKIKRVLVKSVSRFARNTLELLETTRELKELGVVVVFEEQGIDTSQMLGEMQLTMFALAAQEESTSTSKNIRRSYQMRMENGTFVTTHTPIGYDLCDGILVENNDAWIVQKIFSLYISGMGMYSIAAHLNSLPDSVRKWCKGSVREVLTNASAKIGLRQKPLQQEGTGLVLFDFSARRLQMKKTTKVIAVCNQKGGVGKTVTTVNLGIGLARQGKRVLLVDVDPQGSLTASLGFHQPDRIEKTLSTVLGRIVQQQPFDPAGYILHQEEGVDLIPANIDLAMVEMNLVGIMGRETVLRELLEPLRSRYDYILLDCCPSLGTLTANALTAADEVIIPMLAHYLSIKGLEQLLSTIGLVRRKFNPRLQVSGILITMANMRTAYSRDIVALLRESYGDKLRIFDTIIPESIRAAETSAEGKSIYSHDPTGKVSAAYSAFTLEVAS